MARGSSSIWRTASANDPRVCRRYRPTAAMAAIKATLIVDDAFAARRLATLLGEALEPLAGAVSVFAVPGSSNWSVEAYYDAQAAPDPGALSTAIAEMLDQSPLAVAMDPVPEENWVAKSQAALPPVQAGRFVVHGSHDRLRAGGRLGSIEIDAGEAFGTAHHASTLGCLIAIDRIARSVRPPRSVLDLGCGSGVLAIAAAKALPHARILASDIDPNSTAVARGNATRNRVGRRVHIVTATGLDHPALRRGQPFDLVIANILAKPLVVLAPRLRRAIRPGGSTVLSGILSREAGAVVASYRSSGFVIAHRLEIAGWATVTLVRR